jgi:hypothetical protein
VAGFFQEVADTANVAIGAQDAGLPHLGIVTQHVLHALLDLLQEILVGISETIDK